MIKWFENIGILPCLHKGKDKFTEGYFTTFWERICVKCGKKLDSNFIIKTNPKPKG